MAVGSGRGAGETDLSSLFLPAAFFLVTLALGIYGIGRSLWMDEAWVANSILAPSLSGMFYYPDWLQSSPPLFLLLTRAAVHAVGVSSVAFRLVPLALALLGVAGMFAVSRQLLSQPFAALACALLVFHPTAIEYSRTCKQYSGELAASVVILLCTVGWLRQPGRGSFYRLMGAFVLTLPLAWSTVFLIPGVALAVRARGGIRQLGTLVVVCSGVLAILYVVFIRPNLSPQLRTFWIANERSLSPGLIAAFVFCVVAAIRVLLTLKRQPDVRAWMQVVALLPCLLLAAADLAHWYPASPRTRLFALPCFLLVVAINAQDLCGWLTRALPHPRLAAVFVWLITIGVGCGAVWKQIREHRNLPDEDFAGAVQYLRQRVMPADLLLVHPSVIEGFKLYTAIEGWRDHHAIYGDTGWPCCVRDKIVLPGGSTERAVTEDLDRKIPRGFSGRVWMLYSGRHSHWVWAGLDEGAIWRAHMTEEGCPPGPYLVLANLAVSAMECVNKR